MNMKSEGLKKKNIRKPTLLRWIPAISFGGQAYVSVESCIVKSYIWKFK